MDSNLFLSCAEAASLYNRASALPIIDYHCHLSPREIYEDLPFSTITELWLGDDHYKWRLMRSCGVDERYITGDGEPLEKFRRYADCVAYAANNPLYLWSVMELKQFFGIDDELLPENAEKIYNAANAVIREKSLSPRKCILASNVEYIATTDDPADSLEWHEKLKSDFSVAVRPTFRTDKLLNLPAADYPEYIERFSAAAGVGITDLDGFCAAISARLDAFCALGCTISDIGIEAFPSGECSKDEAERIFSAALNGVRIDESAHRRFLTYAYHVLAEQYKRRGVAMQIHAAVKRNSNSELYRIAGADSGGDCVNDMISQRDLLALLDGLNSDNILPRTIIYSLNPQNYTAVATAAGSYSGVTLGAAWWFNDHKSGIEEQLRVYSQTSSLATFTGMLTDSRSFLSYARHDYFRRILADMLGRWVNGGELTMTAANELVDRICYTNAKALVKA